MLLKIIQNLNKNEFTRSFLQITIINFYKLFYFAPKGNHKGNHKGNQTYVLPFGKMKLFSQI